jgi:hypothetical protein
MQVIPDHLVDLVTTDNVAHVTFTEADGSLVTHVLWIDYDGQHLMIWGRTNSYKSKASRARPHVAVSVVDRQNPWRRLSISGRVTDYRPDVGHEFINKLAWRYTNMPYPRAPESEVLVITPDRIRAFNDRFSSPLEVATV